MLQRRRNMSAVTSSELWASFYTDAGAVAGHSSTLFPAPASTLPPGRALRCYADDACMCNAAERDTTCACTLEIRRGSEEARRASYLMWPVLIAWLNAGVKCSHLFYFYSTYSAHGCRFNITTPLIFWFNGIVLIRVDSSFLFFF